MRREITSHKVNGLNEQLRVFAVDEPGHGGACHRYEIKPSVMTAGGEPCKCDVKFQEGPLRENEMNGISIEALLAIVEDRLKGFQAGPYSCRENACALTHLQECCMWLHRRTRERAERGVEGTSAK